MDWIGLLDWYGLDCYGLDWYGLDLYGLEWYGLDWIGLVGSFCQVIADNNGFGLDWVGLVCLNRISARWVGGHGHVCTHNIYEYRAKLHPGKWGWGYVEQLMYYGGHKMCKTFEPS